MWSTACLLISTRRIPSIGRVCGVLLLGSVLLSSLLLAQPAAAASSHEATPQSGEGGVNYVHSTTTANTSFNYTDLDNPTTNNNPNALVFVMPTLPPGVTTFDDHTVGVWYNSSTAKWSIFNEDGATMPIGAAFNIYAVPAAFSGATSLGPFSLFVHTATTANSSGDATAISDSVADGQPSRYLWVTPNWGVNRVFDAHPLGVFYQSGHWSLFHEDGTSVPAGASYNVYVEGAGALSVESRQTVTSTNSTSDYTQLDNSYLNYNPNAIVFATQYLIPPNCISHFCFLETPRNNSTLGVFYNTATQRWCVFNETLTALPQGALLNILGS